MTPVIFLLVVLETVRAAVPSPLLYWTFNTDGVIDDASPPYGVILGSGVTIAGGVAQFNGNGYIKIGPVGQAGIDRSLVAWVTTTNAATLTQGVISSEGNASVNYDAVTLGDQVAGQWTTASTSNARTLVGNNGGALETAGQEVMVAATYPDNNVVTVYRNGVQYATWTKGTRIGYADISKILLGRRNTNTVSNLFGSINEARFYGFALSPAQVAELYALGPVPRNGSWSDTSLTFSSSRGGTSANVTLKFTLDGGIQYGETILVTLPGFNSSSGTLALSGTHGSSYAALWSQGTLNITRQAALLAAGTPQTLSFPLTLPSLGVTLDQPSITLTSLVNRATTNATSFGYVQAVDPDDCLSQPCKNGGTCVDDIGFYTCTCVTGFTDANCTTVVASSRLDPHFIGFKGQRYDVNGIPGKWHNWYSDEDIQVNSLIFTAVPETNATYSAAFAIQLGPRIRIYWAVHPERLLRFFPFQKSGDRYVLDSCGYALLTGHDHVTIVWNQYTITMVQRQKLVMGHRFRFLNFFIDSRRYTPQVHGLLGQTQRRPAEAHGTGPQGQGAIEGTIEDYIVADGHWGSAFPFNAFRKAPGSLSPALCETLMPSVGSAASSD